MSGVSVRGTRRTMVSSPTSHDPYSMLALWGTAGIWLLLVVYPLVRGRLAGAAAGLFVSIPLSDVWFVVPMAIHARYHDSLWAVVAFWIAAVLPWLLLTWSIVRLCHRWRGATRPQAEEAKHP
jgi:hypothetical protein